MKIVKKKKNKEGDRLQQGLTTSAYKEMRGLTSASAASRKLFNACKRIQPQFIYIKKILLPIYILPVKLIKNTYTIHIHFCSYAYRII
jgi:hypothetical protein